MKVEDRYSYRREVVDNIERQLFGPAGGAEEVLTEAPFWRYLSGVLFPSNLAPSRLDVSEEPDVDAVSEASITEDPSLSGAYDSLPASMGVSFFLQGASSVVCAVEAARYQSVPDESSKEAWRRMELAGSSQPLRLDFKVPKAGGVVSKSIFDGLAEMRLFFRQFQSGYLVTATLINVQQADSDNPLRDVEKLLAQCRFSLEAQDGHIGEYPGVARQSLHPEDAELELTYRNRKTYGIGHGCAATWDANARNVRKIFANPIPKLEVKGLTNDIKVGSDASKALSLKWLADDKTPFEDVLQSLDAFALEYENWVTDQEKRARELSNSDRAVAERITGQQRTALNRMRRSIETLRSDGETGLVVRAFRLAQRSMLHQFVWSQKLSGRTFPKGEGQVFYLQEDSPEFGVPKWRPFQLAFQLVVLDSLQDPTSDDRAVLDLLWFPTGGGKTEAYLALSAFEIVLRRLRYGDSGGGTTVLMRYTLRLLTAQQFERCSTLVSVLEHMRMSDPDLGLGEMPISLGLWVGGGTTPNKIDNDYRESPGARQLLEDRVLVDEYPENPFQLIACPHCGTRIVPERRSSRDHYGLQIFDGSLKIHCPDERCILASGIPVFVVDDDIYAVAPTIVIGTIDKFARMVWEPRSRSLLGSVEVGWSNGETGDKTSVLPPSLVIQDELHLITGPLGTVAGVYEAALNTVMKQNGIEPKYLAATATIQRAKEQCERLYAREAFVFPPSGLDASDSYFSREDDSAPGRLYLGAMNNGVFGSLSTLIQGSAAAAHAVKRLAVSAREQEDSTLAVDSYWTQVIYHNSRHELGKTTTILRDDVEGRLTSLEPVADFRRSFEHIVELSGNLKSGAEVSAALERLKVAWPHEDAIDVLACTNMISVGVDIARLGLMIVKGQPKTTSEYIQATSRVGRSNARPPGIVLSLYSSTRPRDRSHYESFQQYHQALYRWVEPTSVTPFAAPALDRTLHAAIVLTIRHLFDLETNDSASKFDLTDVNTRAVLDELLARLLAACPLEDRERTRERFWAVAEEWHDEACAATGRLRFEKVAQFPSLLEGFGQSIGRARGVPWPTLNSMRHVDGETPIANVAELR